MVAYRSDDADVERALRRLVLTVVEHGGLIDDGVEICCERGDLSVRLIGRGDPAAPLIQLPRTALIPVDQITFALEGDDLCIESCAPSLSKGQRRLAEAMLGVYNLCAKLQTHQTTHPSMVGCQDEVLWRRCCAGRSIKGSASAGHEDWSLYLVRSFLETRTLRAGAIPGETGGSDLMMPVVDLVNHHPDSPPFFSRRGDDGSSTLGVVKSMPLTESNECFVSYARLDAYDALLSFGYVERHATFVRSIPLRIQVPDIGVLDIRSTSLAQKRSDLPPQVKDLHAFMPRMRLNPDGSLAASFLLIPYGRSRFALCRVLAILLQRLNPSLSQNEAMARVGALEPVVIEKNIAFYQDLKHFLQDYRGPLAGSSFVTSLQQMADIQLEKLLAYRSPCDGYIRLNRYGAASSAAPYRPPGCNPRP